MRIPLIIAAAVMLQPAHGLSEILYARPDTEVGGHNTGGAMTSFRMRCR